MAVIVQEKDFDLAAELKKLAGFEGTAGAVISFIGLVRGDASLLALELEHYPAMTTKALEEIEQMARTKWGLVDVRIVHRFGRLQLGEQIMMVAVSAPHRRSAFEAMDYIMDFLKSRAPFWKKEHGINNNIWVTANLDDEEALTRW
ncbi:MAG: molybdenum cofactor biosynthesis protein MoaE [Amylibacter sp.]|jgi:molybdopterin synthase catalytic subunit|tara:strand:+ start:5674 stop:6111 length:438 start_codon:yes stop_codon:yes gene_type:complete